MAEFIIDHKTASRRGIPMGIEDFAYRCSNYHAYDVTLKHAESAVERAEAAGSPLNPSHIRRMFRTAECLSEQRDELETSQKISQGRAKKRAGHEAYARWAAQETKKALRTLRANGVIPKFALSPLWLFVLKALILPLIEAILFGDLF